MTRTTVFGLAVVLVALLPPAAWADSISYSSGSPTSSSTGQISASGTWSGATPVQVTLFAFPPCGGQGVEVNATNFLSGTWSVTASGLTSGTTYNVWVVMYNGNGDFATASVQVTVM
jgi:hypothetical protein